MLRNMTGYRTLARNHDFTALWVGQTISALGSAVSMFVFPLLAFALTGSTLAAAAAEALHLLGLAGALLPAGVLADRVDRLRLLRTSSAAGVLLYGSLAAAGVAGALTLPHLLVVAALTGVAAGVFMPAETAAVRAVVGTDDLPTALSQVQARQHVASLLGAPLGGLLYAATRWLPFAADAVSYALSFVLLGRIRADLRPPAATGPRRSARADIVEGLRYAWSRPFFRVLLVWSPLVNLVVNALFFVAILRLVAAGFPPVQIGLVETAAGAAGLLGAVVAPWIIERVPTGWLTVVTTWTFVPLLVPLALWNHPAVVAAALGLGLLLNPAGNAGIGSYRIAVTPDHLQGRLQSSMQFVSMSAMPLSPVLAGALLHGLGGTGAIAVLGALTAAVALIPTLSRSVRSVPRPRAWIDEPATSMAPAASASCAAEEGEATRPGAHAGVCAGAGAAR
jgi:MFS family permease